MSTPLPGAGPSWNNEHLIDWDHWFVDNLESLKALWKARVGPHPRDPLNRFEAWAMIQWDSECLRNVIR